MAASQCVSQQVSWWETHKFIEAGLAQANIGPLPLAGCPAWQALSNDDPRKLWALAVAGEHHILRMDTAQEHQAEASRAISASADWPKLSREIKGRSDFYASRPWLKRTVS